VREAGLVDAPSSDVATFREQRATLAARLQLEQLSAADAAVARAKTALSMLDETRALRELSSAETILARTLTLPGVTVFYAEVQLQLGMCAAQLGLIDIAEAAFMRAARVEPTRRLLTGEAAPEVVALANLAFERASRAAEGEVRIVVNAEHARIFVDDVELGAAPLVLRARAGVHVLRIEAEGFATYATLFDVVEGRRPAQYFELSPVLDPAAVRRFEAARSQDDANEIANAARALLTQAPELRAVVFAQRHAAPSAERSLLVRCDLNGCDAPQSIGTGAVRSHELRAVALTSENLRAARAWLIQDAVAPRVLVRDGSRPSHTVATPLWQRWYVWTGLSAVAIGAAVAVGAATWPEPQRGIRVTVDPSALR
jgi:hypothetical protein